MSLIPSLDAILLQIHSGLGLASHYSTDQKRDFATGQRTLDKHFEMFEEVFGDICDKLGMEMESRSRGDLLRNLLDIGAFNQGLGLRLWTFEADRRQVLWQLLGHSYVPAVARCAANWNLTVPMDGGMPLGRFWYLPEFREQDGELRLQLPVANVVEWLLDLVGMPLHALAESVVPADDLSGAADALIHTLNNWRGETVPEASTIEKYFPDSMKIAFRGAFKVDDLQPQSEQFRQARAFVEHKGLTAEQLSNEVPCTKDELEAILQGGPSEVDQARFVHWLRVRYTAPTPAVIQERLLLARMVQDGYVRLLEELCPGVDRRCADPQQNKALQLIGIYQKVYNLTVQAHVEHGTGDDAEATPAEDAWFEEQLAVSDRLGLFFSILPSVPVETRLNELARMLTLRFFEATPGDPLEDHVGLDLASNQAIAARKVERLAALQERDAAQAHLLDRLQHERPESVLSAEQDYWIVSQAALDTRLPHATRVAAVRRLYELAETPGRKAGTIIIDLARYQPGSGGYPDHARERVEALLAKAKECGEGYDLWKAPLLRSEAKHRLACNDMEEAKRLYRRALEACAERSYGNLRGEIARELFGLEVSNQRLIPNNHERYFREMWFGGMFEGSGVPSIEDTARHVSEYFWRDLYRPYPGVERLAPFAGEAVRELWQPMLRDDAPGVRAWIRKNKKSLKRSLRTATGDSVLMSTIKMSADLRASLRDATLLARMRRGIVVLVESAPVQLGIADFKGQTPLMLMAAAADVEIVRLMLAHGADPDLQDYEGRSALASAVRARHSGCVEVLVEHGCKLDLVTVDGQSALHTAVRFGNIEAATLLVNKAPQLKETKNAAGQTPLELVGELLTQPLALRELEQACAHNGVRCGTRAELELLVAIL